MPIATIEQGSTCLSLQIENDFTRGRLEANTLTAPLAVDFATFKTQQWLPCHLQEMDIEYGVSLAKATVVYRDGILNTLVKKLDAALQMLTGGDTSAKLYQLYFGAQRPFEVARPLLGAQLETMRGWVSTLASSGESILQALSADIQKAVKAADDSVTALAEAEKALLLFRTTGARTQMVDAYNALRKTTYGKLGQIRHQNDELPNDFADTFFMHETRRRDDRLSAEQLQAKIDSLSADLAGLQKKLVAAQAREQAAAEVKEAQAVQLAALAEKKRQAEALAAEIRKLEGGAGLR